MDRLFNPLLRHYDKREKEIYLKAKFILVGTVFITLSLFFSLIYTIWLDSAPVSVVLVESIGLGLMLFSLGVLVKGKYDIAVHTILTISFITIWTILFIEPADSIFTKLDTIVFVPALLAAMPLLFFNSRKPLAIYFSVNMAVFFLFIYLLKDTPGLSELERIDYFLDNSVAIGFVSFVSFALFAIYKNVLTALKLELQDRENALKESENLLSFHLMNTPVGAISWDINFNVTEWNPAAQIIFGYTKQEALGKNAADLILPSNVIHSVTEVFQKALSGTGGKKNINENMTKNGKHILCDWFNTKLINTEGQVVGVASLVNDITERRKTQEIMIQSEKMMSVGGLAAGMAHEINNPLAGMMQNAQVVLNRLTKDIPANHEAARKAGTSMKAIKNFMEKRAVLTHLDDIHQAGERAAKIVANMLSFSKKSGVARKKTNLAELIDNALNLAQNDYNLKKDFDFKSIKLNRKFAPDLPLIYCEETKIQQVVFNIIKNASEAMGQNPPQVPPEIILRILEQPGMACIEIEDNGPGIDKETRKRIFEPFFTTKEVDKGTGLGLSVSYFIIVDDHGGELSVESPPGKGAKFIIKLPFRS
ncbi:MAG: PAS domain S-box protein [Desulfobacter sp.]|nr:PAS domain S-box protein [Desulfobacter sp.]